MAFMRSGRFSVTTATAPSAKVSTFTPCSSVTSVAMIAMGALPRGMGVTFALTLA